MRLTTLLFVLFSCAASASEAWQPRPAMVERLLTGWTAPVRTMELAAEVGGRIAAITVDVGDRVPAGIAVRLDPELPGLAVQQAEAALAQAEAAVADAKASLDAANSDLPALQADVQRSARAAILARKERERLAALDRSGLASGQQLDAAVLADESAVLTETAASARVAAARSRMAQAESGVLSAGAAVASARVAVEVAKAQLRRHEVAGPAGWIVQARLAQPGQVVAAGQPVLRLVDVSELVVALRVSDPEIADLRRRAAAGTLTIAFGPTTVPARLRQVEVAFDPVSRKRLAELVVRGDAAPEASGGLVATVAVSAPDPAGGLEIPADRIDWRLEQPWVFLADGARPIRLLRRDGAKVVVDAASLPAGAAILPVPATPHAAPASSSTSAPAR